MKVYVQMKRDWRSRYQAIPELGPKEERIGTGQEEVRKVNKTERGERIQDTAGEKGSNEGLSYWKSEKRS